MASRKKGANVSEMNCQDVEQTLTLSNPDGTGPLMQSVRAHLETCVSCRQLARILKLPRADIQADPGQIERLQKMIISDLQPLRPLLPSWVFLSAFALIFIVVSYLGVSYSGPYGWFMLMPGQRVAVLATLAASAALLSFSLVRQMVPGQKSLLRPGLLPFGLFAFLCLVLASVFQVRIDPHFLLSGEACLKAGIPYAIPAAFVFWLLLRRGAALSAWSVGAATGMLAGLVSTTVLEVHCSNLNLWHILVWHVGIAMIGLVSGLLLTVAGEAIHRRVS